LPGVSKDIFDLWFANDQKFEHSDVDFKALDELGDLFKDKKNDSNIDVVKPIVIDDGIIKLKSDENLDDAGAEENENLDGDSVDNAYHDYDYDTMEIIALKDTPLDGIMVLSESVLEELRQLPWSHDLLYDFIVYVLGLADKDRDVFLKNAIKITLVEAGLGVFYNDGYHVIYNVKCDYKLNSKCCYLWDDSDGFQFVGTNDDVGKRQLGSRKNKRIHVYQNNKNSQDNVSKKSNVRNKDFSRTDHSGERIESNVKNKNEKSRVDNKSGSTSGNQKEVDRSVFSTGGLDWFNSL